jgi:hypothetical protein
MAWLRNISPVLYALAIGGAFVHAGISYALYLLVALIWLIPDRRIERALTHAHADHANQAATL